MATRITHSVLLFGASGMLGSMILDVLSRDSTIVLSATVKDTKQLATLKRKYPTVQFVEFDAEKDNVSAILKKFTSLSWIINAVGVIKPFIHEGNVKEVKRAQKINTGFPKALQKAVQKTHLKVIQIETDCVYSGKRGDYTEKDLHDPVDTYGTTKSKGEVVSPQFIHLRCSIIGPEVTTSNSLLEWFLHQKKNAHLTGYTNHTWNGVTTLHFAKLCLGLIKENIQHISMQHVIPKDKVSKAGLLHIFAKAFQRTDIVIQDTDAQIQVNRTLQTVHDTINKKLWKAAGYMQPPIIEKMIEELAAYMKGRR